MAQITYVDHQGNRTEIEVENGSTVMQGAIDNMIDGIVAECGGACSCATCHVYVDPDWFDKLPAKDNAEEGLIEFSAAPQENSRLSCQIEVTDELNGLVVHIPESQY